MVLHNKLYLAYFYSTRRTKLRTSNKFGIRIWNYLINKKNWFIILNYKFILFLFGIRTKGIKNLDNETSASRGSTQNNSSAQNIMPVISCFLHAADILQKKCEKVITGKTICDPGWNLINIFNNINF